MPSDAQVLIVGAGPTGLTAASELTRHGVRVRIVEQNPGPSIHSKALVVQPRTLDDVADGGGLVEDRDHDQVPVLAHRGGPTRIAVRQPPRAMPCTSTVPSPRSASRAAAPTRSAPSPPC